MPEIFTVFSEFNDLDSTLVIFSCFDFCFGFCFHVLLSHLSTSSSWQTEVQEKRLPAWSWHILCTVESLDLGMFDDHLSLAPVGRGNGKLQLSIATLS